MVKARKVYLRDSGTLHYLLNFIIVKDRVDYPIDKTFHVAGIEIFLKKYLPAI